MKILHRPRGVLEYQSDKIRLRLKPIPNTQQSLLIIHHLRVNGYIRSRMSIKIDRPSELAEIMAVFEVFVQAASENELESELME